MNKKIRVAIAVVVLLVVGAGAFYWGMSYGKSQGAALSASARAGFAGRIGRAGGAGSALITGSVISNDGNSITLSLPSNVGGSKIIYYSSTTQISKTVSGSGSDLVNGTSVNVTGTTNADGTVTANSIQIRPENQNPPAQ